MIVFETLRWKNFLSTGDQWTEINLDESQSTLIVGQNGSGKSTMLDALCFGLFNKPFRKITRGQLVNSINEKGTKVEVTFSIGKDEYRVFRGIKPNVFELYRNNKLVDQDAAANDTQKYLEGSVLKLNFKSFTQVVILGSSTFVPFMQLGASHRREVIEDLLDIKIFSKMNTLLKDRVKETLAARKECDHLLTVAEQKVSAQTKLLKQLKEVNDNRQKEIQDKIDANWVEMGGQEEELKVKKKELEIQQRQLIDTAEQRTKLDDLKLDQGSLNSELRNAKKEIKFLSTHDNCPTCTQVIKKTFKDKKIKSLEETGESISKNLSNLKTDINILLNEIEAADDISMKCHDMRTDISAIEREIIRLQKENLRREKEIDKLQTVTPNIDKEQSALVEFEHSLEETMKSCSHVNRKLDEFQVISQLLKDSGIKSQIIKKYVPIFNKLINKYLNSMDFFVNFTLDEEFNEKLKSRFRDDFSYASFSEGEKQKIDLSLLFTWREVARMKNSVATNLLILDEVFDSSLDASATNELLQILKSLGQTTNLFVISHKGDVLLDKFLRTLKFEKVNDFSKMSEDS